MKTILKTTAVALLFLFISSPAAKAQERYEYATLSVYAGGLTKPYCDLRLITKDGVESFGTIKPIEDVYPAAVKKANELTAQGWEVYLVNDVSYSTVIFHLRRKAK